MINKRVFGSDIPPKVKQKLEFRQVFAGNSKPNESVNDLFEKYGEDNLIYDSISDINSFDGMVDLSSRTPFARM